MTTTIAKHLPEGWTDRGLGDLPEEVSARLADVLGTEPNSRPKAPKPSRQVAFPTARGIALSSTVGQTEAGVHIEANSTRMELFMTSHGSEPGLRLRTKFDAQLAADLLADPRAALITKHEGYAAGSSVDTGLAEETP